MSKEFGFFLNHRHTNGLARAGRIVTPHGVIETPAFIPVATKATMKGVLPEQMKSLGAQALLANAYHLYLQPGMKVIEKAGGLGKFMNWFGPTFSDSGGFQVMSLGKGYKKVIAMGIEGSESEDITVGSRSKQLAKVDNSGVHFKSHLDGSMHHFTPELSMRIQHGIGADITFAFDELTTLADSYEYQVESLERTHAWAIRSLNEHQRLLQKQSNFQALFGVLQGAQYEDLRKQTARFLAKREFDGFGIGGAIEKSKLGDIVRWCCEELPESKPRHLLGISDPVDIFAGIENGSDTFDCVDPARRGRNGSIYTLNGFINVTNAKWKTDFSPLADTCECYTCQNYTKAYLHHLFKSRERLSSTLATIHNEQFIVNLVDNIRINIQNNNLDEFKNEWLKRFYG